MYVEIRQFGDVVKKEAFEGVSHRLCEKCMQSNDDCGKEREGLVNSKIRELIHKNGKAYEFVLQNNPENVKENIQEDQSCYKCRCRMKKTLNNFMKK